ncbi:zinc ribbon domain-containing protein [Thioflexithrix psekupsensis]|uniref:Uncharacterized protein n=1 Tax=Thioflexithrix psekupsensis TaxID=1570016 RepID=A0A251XAW7_9GAMM|nr:zinc ribbon domain-containing protein [Thioflexithrix psekupsensis]OUD15571.1 hypothetical protein TPSD3_03355 [Thioflexithrix psekupsensis]
MMPDFDRCPVCEFNIDSTANRCPQCGWELPYFLNLTPEDIANYRVALKQAQLAWQQQQQQPPPSPSTSAPSAPATPPLHSEAEESAHDFAQRLYESGPHAAGYANVLLGHYDEKKHSLPLLITWPSWMSMSLNGLYVHVEPETVKTLTAQTRYPVWVQLDADEQKHIIVRGLSLEMPDKQHLGIKQFEDEQYWTWATQHHTLGGYQQYLAAHTLKNHHQTARDCVQTLQKQQRRQEQLVLISGFVIAGFGSALGTGLAFHWFEHFALIIAGGLVGTLLLLGSSFLIYMAMTTLSVCQEATLFAIESINGQRLTQNYIRINRHDTPVMQIRGWAIDKVAEMPAGGVLIVAGSDVITALYGRERPDVVRTLGGEQYRYCGFSAAFYSELLPQGHYDLPLRILRHDRSAYFSPEKTVRLLVE